MTLLAKLQHFASLHDDLETILERHELVESFPSTDNVEELRWYLRNLSTNSENGQWTLDETIYSRSVLSGGSIIIRAIYEDLDHYDSTPYLREHLVSILYTVNNSAKPDDRSLRSLVSEVDPSLVTRFIEVVKQVEGNPKDLIDALLSC